MAPRPPTLSDALRAETADSHARLEEALDLLTPPAAEERFRRILTGFYGFHAAWEPALACVPGCAEMLRDRSRLDVLRSDLLTLGLSDHEIDALPHCAAAADLCTERTAALGSFYVMEGSTMGGQLIARALIGAAWAPPQGLGYFNPYGSQAGARWRSFKAWLDGAAPQEDWPDVVNGADRTFDTLRTWMTADPR